MESTHDLYGWLYPWYTLIRHANEAFWKTLCKLVSFVFLGCRTTGKVTSQKRILHRIFSIKRPQRLIKIQQFWPGVSSRPALRCGGVDGQHFEHGAFRKQWSHHYHVIFLPYFFLKHKPKIISDCCVIKNCEHRTLQVQNTVYRFQFLWRGECGRGLNFTQRKCKHTLIARCLPWNSRNYYLQNRCQSEGGIFISIVQLRSNRLKICYEITINMAQKRLLCSGQNHVENRSSPTH